jgi:hypothetical protein
VKDDTHQYRLAIIEAFRKRGLFPRDVRNLNEESLIWHAPNEVEQAAFGNVFSPDRLRDLIPHWELTTNREKIFESAQTSKNLVKAWFLEPSALGAVKAAGLVLEKDTPEAFYRGDDHIPELEVHSVRPARRIGPSEQTVIDLVIEMTQRRRGYKAPTVQAAADSGTEPYPNPDFIYRGGCTLLVDPNTATVRYCIYKRILSKNRIERMRQHLYDSGTPSLQATYFGDPRDAYFQHITGANDSERRRHLEPFALLHRSFD